MLTEIQYRLLKKLSAGSENHDPLGGIHQGRDKLKIHVGSEVMAKFRGKTVIDFGCGFGSEAIAIASVGAKRVLGIDNRERVLEQARRSALLANVQEVCEFATSTTERADIILSIDAFEHFSDPAHILRQMHKLLLPGGEALVSFGPTWYHPLGGHLFSVFPWAHLIFSERALIRWRSDFKFDGATRFHEVEGGLNQMTIRRFEKLLEESPFRSVSFEPVPIRKLRRFHNGLTREFTTSLVRCRLVSRNVLPDSFAAPKIVKQQ